MYRAQGLGWGVKARGLGFQGSEFRVWGSGFRVQGLGFGVQDLGFMAAGTGPNSRYALVAAAPVDENVGQVMISAFMFGSEDKKG